MQKCDLFYAIINLGDIMEYIDSLKPKVTMLSYDQVVGDRKDFFEITSGLLSMFEIHNRIYAVGSNCLKLFKKYDAKCGATDCALLQGAKSGDGLYDDNNKYDRSKISNSGYWYIINPEGKGKNCVEIMRPDGYLMSSDESRYLYETKTGIRPVLSFDELPNFWSHVSQTIKGIPMVEYGEYPQFAVDEEKDKRLTHLLNENKLVKTGKIYFDKFEEYEYGNKKYVRVTYDTNVKLANDREINRSACWLEVEPIQWIVDEENKLFISTRILAGGIHLDQSKSFTGSFEDTPIYKFLTQSFAKDLIPSKSAKERETERKSKLTRVEVLLEEIYSLLDIVPNKDEIAKQIEAIITEYNNTLDKVEDAKKNNQLSLYTIESASLDAEVKLEAILDNVRKQHIKYKNYYTMLDLIDSYINILNGKEIQIDDIDLDDDLHLIATVCLPFLSEVDQSVIKNDLLNVINAQKQEVLDFINDKEGDAKIPYETIQGMNLDLRREIHPVLEKLRDTVNKRDIQLEIMESLRKTMEGNFEIPKNQTLAFFLQEINEAYSQFLKVVDKATEKQQEKYKEEALEIMNREIDYSKDIISIVKELREILSEIGILTNRIERYSAEIENIENRRIDLSKIKKI